MVGRRGLNTTRDSQTSPPRSIPRRIQGLQETSSQKEKGVLEQIPSGLGHQRPIGGSTHSQKPLRNEPGPRRYHRGRWGHHLLARRSSKSIRETQPKQGRTGREPLGSEEPSWLQTSKRRTSGTRQRGSQEN